MIPVELSIISRSAEATGPFGSSTPSEQPPSAAAPINKTASATCCMSGLFKGLEPARDEGSSSPGRGGARRGTGGNKERPEPPAIPDAERCEQQKQVQDGKSEQPVCRASIGFVASDQPQRERNECRSAEDGSRAIDRAGKPKRPRQQ